LNRFLGLSVLVKIFVLSFGLYLWHWVILSFYQYHNDNRPGVFIGICIILLSWLLSYLMTRYIEKPIRTNQNDKKSFKKMGVGLAVNICVLAALYVIILNSPFDKEKEALSKTYPGAMAIDKK